MSKIVLIAGAGPVGLTLAAELQRYGVKVRVVDRAAAPSGQSRALFLWSRTLELLDRAGLGATLMAAGQKIEALNIQSGSKHIGRVDFADIDSPHPYALMLPQAETERILAAYLETHGVQVERGTELAAFENNPDEVIVALRRADGSTETLLADYVVGCDGGSSFVRKTLGLSSTGPAQSSNWVLADVDMAGFASPRTELTSFWHEDGFLGLFPLPSGQTRVIADIKDDGAPAPGTPDLAAVQALVDKRGPGGVVLSNPRWLTSFRVQERNVTAYRVGRVFLAGDAAHLHNPVGAQGLNMGIHDVVNLAWKLALAQRGVANAARVLDSYNTERHEVAEHVVANIGRAAAVGTIRSPSVQFARNLLGNLFFGLAPARKAMAEQLTEVSLGYKNSLISGFEDQALPAPNPGARVPPRAGQTPLGAGRTPLFGLYATSSPRIEALRTRFADLLEPELRAPLSQRCVWLARPDGYVAAECLEEDIDLIERYLAYFVTPAEALAVI